MHGIISLSLLKVYPEMQSEDSPADLFSDVMAQLAHSSGESQSVWGRIEVWMLGNR